MNAGRILGTTDVPKLRESLLVAALALVFYNYLFGVHTLTPTHTGWMLHGDPAQHYLGWEFFRNERWHWPPGHIAGFGLPGGTSIAFTDSIPLLALLIKPVSGLLPDEFQYFGWWMVGCYVLNGYFGLRLLSLYTNREWLRIIGAGFFILSYPVILRSSGHEALMAHWLILAGIDICLRGWNPRRWFTLCGIAALCHPYLLLMVLGLLMASAARAVWIERNISPSSLVWQVTGIICMCTGLFWIAGYLENRGGLGAEGYGFFSMNILAFVDPTLGSQFLQRHDIHPDFAPMGQYEGTMYLGAGLIMLAFIAFPFLLQTPRSRIATAVQRHWPLLGMAVLFWVLALSNKVMFGSVHLFTVPLPETLIKVLSIFRASGRFGWPLYYLLMLGIVVLAVRRLPHRASLYVLIAALSLQFADQKPAYRDLRKLIDHREALQSPLQSAQWSKFAARAKELVLVPPHPPLHEIYIPFAQLAATHGLETNAAYIARPDAAGMGTYGEVLAARLASGQRDAHILYIFLDPTSPDRLPECLRAEVQGMDGVYVLPPSESETCANLD